jgi:hypothetical protein
MSETKKAFVLMPFKEPYNSYYPAIFRPALESAGYSVSRADDVFTPRPVMLDVQKAILDADLILCEMSERNPNVFYELGLFPRDRKASYSCCAERRRHTFRPPACSLHRLRLQPPGLGNEIKRRDQECCERSHGFQRDLATVLDR